MQKLDATNAAAASQQAAPQMRRSYMLPSSGVSLDLPTFQQNYLGTPGTGSTLAPWMSNAIGGPKPMDPFCTWDPIRGYYVNTRTGDVVNNKLK